MEMQSPIIKYITFILQIFLKNEFELYDDIFKNLL